MNYKKRMKVSLTICKSCPVSPSFLPIVSFLPPSWWDLNLNFKSINSLFNDRTLVLRHGKCGENKKVLLGNQFLKINLVYSASNGLKKLGLGLLYMTIFQIGSFYLPVTLLHSEYYTVSFVPVLVVSTNWFNVYFFETV